MHNGRLAVDDSTLNEHFDAVLSLLRDESLKKHVSRYMDANTLIKSVEKVKN